ncbi:bifunctional 2-polyprenyl-6-hydroxyphenol methylase/3-demethylubiquinol 3-O-methyltransferase UbiG [Coxiella endosymbiont of Amblyomma nuttalli]|uniref:bifunctional 2-polyprenyl-6-hydroxyphenol methylase/3-demethylubiquinol 3-O-methyltransferase UbiG n=1 Tax=Coxiella endosymbiont of Amblyomma nuttalli TaxID=2749996 RepID=UPI001BAB4DE4|nr:bifunctional 2-polyprenyl-6-hydroxyphenol methylase/3-demethylubiquinol 3-O-methyltransferase UbiG [Coxiella endosymbiont of Amblyomma nuttalli]QTS84030.1 Ubiquinone biosynthesis O-methyltransferase [Coxiella endosymbiont of Amblyomma nuttalli]
MNNTNTNESELAKFSHLADDWWNPDGDMKPLHQMNPIRLAYIRQQISLTNKAVLDVGCGGGLLSEILATGGAKVTGVDMNKTLIAVAKNHAKQQQLKIDYYCEDVESVAETGQRFDIVTCMELLEHVPDPLRMIQTCSTLTKSGGKLFFSTINRNVKSYLFAIVGAEYIMHWLPKGTHSYAQFIRPSELTYWAQTAQLRLVDLTGIQYHPFKNEFNLSRDVSVNYLAYFTKLCDQTS